VHRDGTRMRKIVPFSRDVGIKSDWSPNGHRIVFTEYLDSTYTQQPPGVTTRVATVRRNGSHLRELTHGTSTDHGTVAGSFSPDGTWIVYRFDNFITDRYSLYRMHPDGSNRTRIVRLALKARGLDWGAQ
jgi:Tol biopolymer transport system component